MEVLDQSFQLNLWELKLKYPWPKAKPDLSPLAKDSPGWPLPENVLGINLTEETKLVLELGSWLGASARFILNYAPNATVLCVDHFLGSLEHFQRSKTAELIPTLYEDFLSLNWEHRDRIVPIRERTLDGMRIVADFGLVPDLVFIDASHDYESVKADLETANRLFPTATIIGDDYLGVAIYKDGEVSGVDFGVRRAVNHFIYERGWDLQCIGRGWQIIRKPSKNGD